MPDLKDRDLTKVNPESTILNERRRDELLGEISGWQLHDADGEEQLQRPYKFEDFADALLFTQKIGELAETFNHHPRLITEWGYVTVSWWTHAVGGLHTNDFIMAAKTDDIYQRWQVISGKKDAVQLMLEETFPASDAPAI